MKKILLTAFIALGFGFAAMAQMEPVKAKVNKKTDAAKKAAILKYKMDTEKAAQQSAKPVVVNSATADKASEVYKKN